MPAGSVSPALQGALRSGACRALPSLQSRAQLPAAVAQAFDACEPILRARLQSALAAGRTQGLYDLQMYTDPVERYAAEVADVALAQRLSALYLLPLASLDRARGRWLGRPRPGGVPQEVVLDSAQLLYGVARHCRHLLASPALRTSAASKAFVAAWWPVLCAHLDRWAFGAGGELCFSVAPWGCGERRSLDHEHLLSLKLLRRLGSQHAHCNAVTDVDLWIMGIAAEMAMASKLASACVAVGPAADRAAQPASLAPLSAATARRLSAYLELSSSLLYTRFAVLPLTDLAHRPRRGLGFDHGAWDEHPDYAASGGRGVGWDLSHARRLVSVLLTWHELARQGAASFPRAADLGAFADAVVLRTFDGNLQQPRFASYLDGSNGFYRKVPPYGLSEALATGGYAALGEHSADLRTVSRALLRLLTSSDELDRRFVETWYPAAVKTPELFALQLLPALYHVLP